MFDRHWLKFTLLLTFVLAGAVAGTNAYVDLFGVFREPAGRHLKAYGDDRVAKYLMSKRYVGANFEGVLIGSSMTANWKVGHMTHAHLYNESVDGANVVEEKVLLDQVLSNTSTPPKMVLLVVHPYLTASHEFETVNLSERELWGALGSKNLLEAYKGALKASLGGGHEDRDSDGSEDFGDSTRQLNATLQRLFSPGSDFPIDPVAEAHFRAAVAAVHARRIPLAFIVPPTYEGLLSPKRAAFDRYVQTLLSARGPDDRVLDFSAEEFASFRRNESNFSDGVHLREAGAAEVTRRLDEEIATWQKEGWANKRVTP
jgi:hypothetical protein